MGVTADVTIDGNTYTVPRMNAGQIKRMSLLSKTKDGLDSTLAMLNIAGERSEPKMKFDDTIEPVYDELSDAVATILAMNRRLPKEGE